MNKELTELLEELKVMERRLVNLSNAANSDMEGADEPEFSIADSLWRNCAVSADRLRTCAKEIQRAIDENGRSESK